MKKTLWAVYLLSLLAGILFVNPYLFSKQKLWSAFKPEDYIWKPMKPPESFPAAGGPLAVYRGDSQRGARFKVESLDFELKEVWKSEAVNVGIHTASKASVIGDGERFFTGSDSSWFYAFSKSGEVLWKVYLGQSTRGIHSTAALDQSAVYVGSYRGALYKLDSRTGKIIWMRILGQAIGASPLLDSKYITVAVEIGKPDGYIVKLRKETGEIVWRSDLLGEQSHSSPALSEDGSLLLVGANNSTVQAFDYETGQRVWKRTVSGAVKSTVLIHGGLAYVSTWGNELVAFEVSRGQRKWRARLAQKSQVSPVFLKKANLIFVADLSGEMTAWDALTGKLKWKINPESPPKQISSPVVLESAGQEKVLFACEQNKMCLIQSKGHVEKKWGMGGVVSGSPFVIGGSLFVSINEGGVEAYKMTVSAPRGRVQ